MAHGKNAGKPENKGFRRARSYEFRHHPRDPPNQCSLQSSLHFYKVEGRCSLTSCQHTRCFKSSEQRGQGLPLIRAAQAAYRPYSRPAVFTVRMKKRAGSS